VYRTRPWMVVLLVAATALVAGFARLDSAHKAPARAPAAQGAEPPGDVEPLHRYLKEMVQFLKETEAAQITPMSLPPLDQLPPLPPELFPPEDTGTELSSASAD
jgi:hypothetical protein